jgi:hypothetical protein
LQVRPFSRGVEVSGGGAATNSVLLRELKAPDSHLQGPIEIIILAIARSHSRLDQMIIGFTISAYSDCLVL